MVTQPHQFSIPSPKNNSCALFHSGQFSKNLPNRFKDIAQPYSFFFFFNSKREGKQLQNCLSKGISECRSHFLGLSRENECVHHISVRCGDSVTLFPISFRGQNPQCWHSPRKWKAGAVFCGAAPGVDGQPGSGLLRHLSNK